MWKVLVGFVVFQIMINLVTARAVEIVESSEEQIIKATQEPVNIPISIGPARKSPNIFKGADLTFFNFMDQLVNGSYMTSQTTLKKIREHTAKLKDIGAQVEDLVESLPSFPIPVVDDMSHAKLFQ